MNFTNISKSSPSHIFSEVYAVTNDNSLFARTINFFPRILIVENDEDTRLMMKYLLKLWNYRIIEASDDEDAIQMAEIHRPDLILISDRLQKIDALTTTRRIRQLSEPGDPVIIFITGYSEPSVHASALAAGANDFMIKPIDFGQLEIRLKKYLRKKYKPHETSVKGVL